MKAADIARDFTQRGWAPVPVKHKSKKPTVEGWPDLRITTENLGDYFNGAPQNVGVILGKPSGGLTDLDFDCLEARQLAPALLPATMTFGRKTSSQSHWLYVCTDTLPATTKFKSPADDVLLEIRGNGHQTVFPGSVHESGEQIEWTDQRSLPTALPGDEISQAARRLAAASLLVRSWTEGQRDDLAYALCGCLLRGGWDVDEINNFIEAIASVAGDDDVPARLKADKVADSEKKPGIPKLKECLSPEVAELVIEWLDLATEGLDLDLLLQELNAKHATVWDGDKLKILHMTYDPNFRRDEPSLIPPYHLQTFYENRPKIWENQKPKNQIKWWLEQPDRRDCKGFVLDPRCTDPDVYNLWEGWSVKSDSAASCDLYLDHIRDNIAQGDEEIYDYILNWMADAIQNPTDRPGIAFAMRGGQGTGKGLFVKFFGALYGRHFVHVKSPDHFLGRFNKHLQYCLLLFADEAVWGGNKQAEGKFKGLVTESEIHIEGKFENARAMPNNIRAILASNHEWIVPAGMDERRFFIVDVGEDRAQNHQYFGELVGQMEGGGCGRLLHILQTRDLTGINLRKFPMTPALLEQKIATMDVEIRFLYDIAKDGLLPGDREGDGHVPKQVFYNRYQQFARNVGGRYRRSSAQLGTALHKLLPGLKNTKPHRGGRGYQFPPLKELRICLEKKLRQPIPWSEQEDWEPGEEEDYGQF